MTAEQEARDMLERMDIEGAQSFTSGDVVELANLFARVHAFSWADVDELRTLADVRFRHETHYESLMSLADRIAALLPPR